MTEWASLARMERMALVRFPIVYERERLLSFPKEVSGA